MVIWLMAILTVLILTLWWITASRLIMNKATGLIKAMAVVTIFAIPSTLKVFTICIHNEWAYKEAMQYHKLVLHRDLRLLQCFHQAVLCQIWGKGTTLRLKQAQSSMKSRLVVQTQTKTAPSPQSESSAIMTTTMMGWALGTKRMRQAMKTTMKMLHFSPKIMLSNKKH